MNFIRYLLDYIIIQIPSAFTFTKWSGTIKVNPFVILNLEIKKIKTI